jgi:hypothetical protein
MGRQTGSRCDAHHDPNACWRPDRRLVVETPVPPVYSRGIRDHASARQQPINNLPVGDVPCTIPTDRKIVDPPREESAVRSMAVVHAMKDPSGTARPY